MDKDHFFASLPPDWPADLLPAIRDHNRRSGRKLVVLDDDPTGTQTVSNLAVLTEWPVERLAAELMDEAPAFYLLTNSRALPLASAQALNAEIGKHLLAAAHQTGRQFTVVSRSDSTLRGHFPGEVQALDQSLGGGFDAWIVAPCFPEGGRFTAGDVHYVAEGSQLIPAGQTEFARDKTFGYRASNLRDWALEKFNGSLPPEQVTSISLETLRGGGPQAVIRQLLDLPPACPSSPRVCVANAVSYRDLEVLALGLLEAESAGRRFLYRTAASFVRVAAGLQARPLLSPADLGLPSGGAGLVIAGSYVPRTTAQLEALFQTAAVERVEMNVKRLLDEAQRPGEVERAQNEVNHHLEMGRLTVLYTSRQLLSSQDGGEADLAIGQVVSGSLVSLVRGLRVRPRYLLAKGGITSSDIATRGLGIRRAVVLGQVLPGVPAWQAGPESRYPGLAYIVFPGNVGGTNALVELIDALSR